MNLKKAVFVGVIAVSAVVLAGCKSQVQTGNQGSINQATSASDATGQAVITYDGTSFSPSELKIKAGESVTVKNASSGPVQVNSAVHPTHTLFPELNVGKIGSGASKSFTVSKAGNFTYHNHLNVSQKGTIVAE